MPTDIRGLTEQLAAAGFVAAAEEAVELLAAAFGDAAALEAMVARRLSGEPLAWITGLAPFCGRWVVVRPGVYIPRQQSEPLVHRAAELLAPGGVAVDVCTGSGAVAATLAAFVPGARVLACDVDPAAVACARANGVEAYRGDLLDPVPAELRGAVDLVVGVPPYVPRDELPFLQRDTFTFESPLAYDGGPDGLDLVRRIVAGSAAVLRPGGTLLVEVGGAQPGALAADLQRHGFAAAQVRRDDDGDVRGLEARLER